MAAEKDVVVNVGGDTSVLKREMRKGSDSVKGFGETSRKELAETAKTMAKLGAAALAAGSAIVAGLVKKGSELVDQQAKLAKAMKTTTASIQTLHRVSELEGIPSLVGNMEALTRRLSRAANGTGPAVKALDQLHLSAEQLLSLPADKRLELIGQRMKELIDPTEQQAIAFDLFDASGAKIAETIADGGTAIKNARNEIQQFGVALTEVDAKQVEVANDAMSSFGIAIQAVSQNLAIEFAPALKFIGTRFGDLIKQNDGLKESIRTAFNIAGETMAVFADGTDIVRIAFQGLRVSVAGFTAFFAIVFSDALGNAARELQLFVKNVVVSINEVVDSINKKFGTSFDRIGQPDVSWLDVLNNAGPKATEHLSKMREELTDMVRQFSVESTGDKIRSFMKTVVEESRKAGVALSRFPLDPLENVGGPGLPESMLTQQFPTGDPKADSTIAANESFQRILQQRLEVLQQHLATEKDLEIAAHSERLAELQFLQDQGVVKDEERRRLQEELELQHIDKLTEIRKKGLSDLEKFNAMSFAKQTSTVLGEMANMTNGVARENKALFEINKQAATAEAIVQGFLGVQRTLGAYPFPVSVAMAGLQAAASVAQVSAIQSQTFNGGGSAAPSLAGSTAAPPVSNVGGTGSSEQNVFIKLQGEVFGQDSIRQLIKEINEASKNGARIQVA